MRFSLFQHRRTKKQDKKIYKQEEEKKDKETKKKNPTLNGKCLKKNNCFSSFLIYSLKSPELIGHRSVKDHPTSMYVLRFLKGKHYKICMKQSLF